MSAPRRISGHVRIGISGWRYTPWRGVFYPPKLPQRKELAFAASQFPTIELNGSFYSLQRPSHYEQWAAETPPEFVFAIKGSRFITHMRKLRQVRTALANFFASGILKLDSKLGPFLWQFAPNFRFNPDLLDEFFTLLPRDTQAAADLACEHDPWMKGRVCLETPARRPLRHAIEIRHESFVCPEFIRLLRRHKIALVCADTVEWPRLLDVTADFLYLRLHGSEVLYASGYDGIALDVWAERITAWARGHEPRESWKEGHAPDPARTHVPEGVYASFAPAPKRTKRDVYVYFDNDAKVRAPFDAQGLIERVNRLLLRKPSI
ncbi:MAG TPA: DUF72 domain-containing protein [Acidobacteriaceae bacterium]|nr:DUF72 domain-containing protein [Acidobacteriaceae bacterium]